MTERRQEPLRADAMSAQNYADTMTPNSPAAGSTGNLPGPRDFFRLDRRNVMLGLTAAAMIMPGYVMFVALGNLGGWVVTVLASLWLLPLLVFGRKIQRRVAAAYDRREAERTGASSG